MCRTCGIADVTVLINYYYGLYNPTTFESNGKLFTESLYMANQFNDYFINIGPSLAANIDVSQQNSHKDYLDTSLNHTFNFELINENQVLKIIDSLPNKSSYGYDNISLKFNEICQTCFI